MYPWISEETTRKLTINNRFNLGDLQNILQILRSEIGYTQTSALQSPILNKTFQDGPELPNLSLFGYSWSVNQEKVGRGLKFGEGFLDVLLD